MGASSPKAADTGNRAALCGTWKLLEAIRRTVETGNIDSVWGKHPSGFIAYGDDGRVIAVVAYGGRIRPESFDKVTADQERALYRSMLAFAGTYTFDGETIRHEVEVSWNECWTGTTLVRRATIDCNRLTLVTVPLLWADGKKSVITSVWEKAG